jgi:hypothetical protein
MSMCMWSETRTGSRLERFEKDWPPDRLRLWVLRHATGETDFGLAGAGSRRWSGSPVPAQGSSRWSDPPALGHRPPVRTGGKNELPATPYSMSFLAGLTIVYGRIKKLSTDNGSETLTQGLRNLGPGHSIVININRYGSTYRIES